MLETTYLPGAGRVEETVEPGVEWIDGQLQPSRSAREAMSTAIDGALELVLSFITVNRAEPATRRILLEALAGTVDDELRRLDSESEVPTGTETAGETVAAIEERKDVLTVLRNRTDAMPEAGPSAVGVGRDRVH